MSPLSSTPSGPWAGHTSSSPLASAVNLGPLYLWTSRDLLLMKSHEGVRPATLNTQSPKQLGTGADPKASAWLLKPARLPLNYPEPLLGPLGPDVLPDSPEASRCLISAPRPHAPICDTPRGTLHLRRPHPQSDWAPREQRSCVLSAKV